MIRFRQFLEADVSGEDDETVKLKKKKKKKGSLLGKVIKGLHVQHSSRAGKAGRFVYGDQGRLNMDPVGRK